MNDPTSWRPLLTGEPAAEAWQAILDVAAALRASATEPAANVSHADGAAGLALFFSYLAESRREDEDADLAESFFDQAVAGLAGRSMGPGLFSGFTGVAWMAEHLEGRLFESEDEEDEEPPEVDDALIKLLGNRPWRRNFDLISGLVGFGVYALERLPRPAARECLELVLGHLEELAEDQEPGVTWLTRPELLPPHQREQAPQGHYNLGIAHGIAGVIGFLGMVCGVGVAAERSRPLLDAAVAWLLAQEQDAAIGSSFPHFLAPDVPPHPSRLAWCYGDLGIAVVLLLAARASRRTDWERTALRFARRAAAQPAATAMVGDAGLCHGAAGVGHLLNRLYQATGEEDLADAARFWFRSALGMRRPDEGIGGFLSWAPAKGGWVVDRGFLTGAAGMAMALLAAVSPPEPAWDRVLLTAISPQS